MFHFLRSILSPYSKGYHYNIVDFHKSHSTPVHISGLLTYKKKPRNRSRKKKSINKTKIESIQEVPLDFYSGDWVEVKRKTKWFSDC